MIQNLTSAPPIPMGKRERKRENECEEDWQGEREIGGQTEEVTERGSARKRGADKESKTEKE